MPSVEAACRLKTDLSDPLLAGELGGEIAPGFEINNSPSELDSLNVVGRPVILLSSSGTRLIHQAKGCEIIHLACFRNYRDVARHLVDRYRHVAVIGAGSRGEFREEDQMCCAWIARDLVELGYLPENHSTADLIERWHAEGPEAARNGKSADYLRRSCQEKDLEFILAHINDLHAAYVMHGDEVTVAPFNEKVVAATHNSIVDTIPGASTAC